MESLKVSAIKEYLSKIDFKNDDWSIYKISQDMQRFLGELPAIDITYKKDVMITEFTGEAKEIRKLNKVSIVFTDINDKITKLDVII
jgi:hypothetical protein